MSKYLENVKRYQECGFVHPLTCRKNSKHKVLEPIEISSGRDGVVLTCVDCGYYQDVVPETALDFTEEVAYMMDPVNIFGIKWRGG